MVKRLSTLIFTLLLLFTFNSLAADASIVDEAEILSPSAIESINSLIDDTRKEYNIPVYVYTTNEYIKDSQVEERVDGLLRDRVGANNSGFLLYINMTTRDVRFTMSGEVMSMIDDRRQDGMLNKLLSSLKNSDYDKAVLDTVKDAKYYISQGPIAGNKLKERQGLSTKDIAGAGVGGLAAFFLSMFGIKNKNKSRPQRLVYSLMDNTRANFAPVGDAFIATRTTSRLIPRSSSASGGSGSSTTTTHTSSGGGSFSGKGGKF